MLVNRTELASLANHLIQARRSRIPCAPLTELQPLLSLNDAYVISEITLDQRMQQGGLRMVGKKVGLTSRAVQRQLGVKEPDFGFLTDDMFIPNDGVISMGRLLQPRVEGELAFVLKRNLKGPGITVAQVIQATDFLLPCIEVIDSRIKDWKIGIQDTVADNASSAFVVLGNEPVSLGKRDLRLAGMRLSVDGEVLSTGVGAACLDHPALAVAWLANSLGARGVELKAGEVILSGAFGPVVPVVAGQSVVVAIEGMGEVRCGFRGAEHG
jgi:2-oxopent-4-enoate hydratase